MSWGGGGGGACVMGIPTYFLGIPIYYQGIPTYSPGILTYFLGIPAYFQVGCYYTITLMVNPGPEMAWRGVSQPWSL